MGEVAEQRAILGVRLILGHQQATLPVLGGDVGSAPKHPLQEVMYRTEVKLTARLEKGSG